MVVKSKDNGELVYGVHPVLEVMRARRRAVLSIYTTKPVPKQWSLLERQLIPGRTKVQYVTREVLGRMAGSSEHQGVVALVTEFPYRKKAFEAAKHPFLLVLDRIQDTRNLGAILRSAYCTGVSGVIMTTKNSAPLGSVAMKASAGLAEHLEIQTISSAQDMLGGLGKAGYGIYLAALQGDNAIAATYSLPLCLVIGNEAEGIEKRLLSYGTVVTLPQKKTDISYNASVAAGILLFTIASRNKII